MAQNLINANPTVYNTKTLIRKETEAELDDDIEDPIDAQEVFDLIRSISDPEHPLTLEQLNVTQFEHIQVDNQSSKILIEFTPTIPHCSMATLIGLCIRVRLLRSLPDRFKVNFDEIIQDSNLIFLLLSRWIFEFEKAHINQKVQSISN